MSERTMISLTTGTILRTVAILLGLAVLWMIRDIILYVFSALILAGVMYPITERAKRKYRVPKGISVTVLYVLLLGLVTSIFSLVIPAVLSDARGLANAYGQSFSGLKELVENIKELSYQVGLGNNVDAGLAGIQTQITNAVSSLVAGVTDIFGSITGFIIVLALALYLILEENAVKQACKSIIPLEYQAFASDVTWHMMQKLGDWLRSQLLLGLLIGTVYFLALTLMGIPFTLILAIIGGFLEFIPFIGPIIAAIPIIVVAFSVSPAMALIAGIVILIIHQIESQFIAPKIMQKTIGLNPVISIIAFMIGAKLFNLIGAIFAIPIAAAISVFLQEFFLFRQQQEQHKLN